MSLASQILAYLPSHSHNFWPLKSACRVGALRRVVPSTSPSAQLSSLTATGNSLFIPLAVLWPNLSLFSLGRIRFVAGPLQVDANRCWCSRRCYRASSSLTSFLLCYQSQGCSFSLKARVGGFPDSFRGSPYLLTVSQSTLPCYRHASCRERRLEVASGRFHPEPCP